jgi:hypothetical protein
MFVWWTYWLRAESIRSQAVGPRAAAHRQNAPGPGRDDAAHADARSGLDRPRRCSSFPHALIRKR